MQTTKKRSLQRQPSKKQSFKNFMWRKSRLSVYAMLVFAFVLGGTVAYVLKPAASAASVNSTYVLKFPCGGANGNIQINQPQSNGYLWGTMYMNNQSGCKGGKLYLYFSYTWNNYILGKNDYPNYQVYSIGLGQYTGNYHTYSWNHTVTDLPNASIFNVKVTLCSSIGGWHCGPYAAYN